MWTSEPPQVQGWYWWRKGNRLEVVVMTKNTTGKLKMGFVGSPWSRWPKLMKGEWCGPIVPPE